MIDVIGTARTAFIAWLIVLNLAFAGIAYYYFSPKLVQAERELRSTKGQAAGKRSEVVTLRDEFKLLKLRIQKFRELEISGFFEIQNRLKAVESVNEFREKAGLLNAKLDVKSGEIREDARVDNIGHAYLVSPMSIELESLDDLEIYTFMRMVESRFPGKTLLESLEIEKIGDLTTVNLSAIADGVPTALVKGRVPYDWITLPERERLSQ